MKQLNTLIQINEIKYITNSLLHEANGYLEIKYFGNEINNKNEIILKATVTKEIEAFEVNLEIKFTYTNECSRCLTKNNKEDRRSKSGAKSDFRSKSLDSMARAHF